jgi:hypothetical protein
MLIWIRDLRSISPGTRDAKIRIRDKHSGSATLWVPLSIRNGRVSQSKRKKAMKAKGADGF